jgi:transposase
MAKSKIKLPQTLQSEKYNRYFSEEFRKSKVADFEKGITTIKMLCSQYNITRTTVYKWIHLYSNIEKGTKKVIQMESEEFKTKLLMEKVGELERIVGQKQIEIDYLNKLIELESKSIGYDIKKKGEQALSNGIELTII